MPDWLGQAVISSAGTATVTLKHNTSGIVWEIQQITTQTGIVAAAATTFIKKNGIVVAPSASLTPIDVGQAATAGGLPYLYINGADTITIQIQGGTNRDTMTVRAQYREFHDTDPDMIGR